jgi:hypothetical protein
MYDDRRAKIRRVLEYIRSDRDKFEVTEERVNLWTEALGWAEEPVLMQAVRDALGSLKSGFPNLAHVQEKMPGRRAPEPFQRSWEDVFRIILQDCSFSDPEPPKGGSMQELLSGYETWRRSNPQGVLFPPPHWTEQHHSSRALLAFLDRHACSTITETIPI